MIRQEVRVRIWVIEIQKVGCALSVFALRLSAGTLQKPDRIHAQKLRVRFGVFCSYIFKEFGFKRELTETKLSVLFMEEIKTSIVNKRDLKQ